MSIKHVVFCLFLFIFFKFYFIFKLYIIVLVLPNIKMHPPQVYMCSPSWILLPPPSPFHPSGSSQCTSPKHPVSCIEPGLATRFLFVFKQWLLHKSHELLYQFSSVAQSCPTLCNPMSCSMPGLSVQHQLPEPTQTHVQNCYIYLAKWNVYIIFVKWHLFPEILLLYIYHLSSRI